jgi:phosphoribosylanthranilate isomerase
MTKIKICGIKTLSDGLAAIEAGADYLGFNFYSKSVRFIDMPECAKITAVLKAEHSHIKLVGVFVNVPAADIQTVLQSCSLDLAQLHGDEPPEALAQLAPHAFKAFRGVPANVDVYTRNEAPACLIDAAVKGAYGGTGVTADWSAAAELAERYPLLLAGGLTPDNVAAAVRQVRPWGVDVASGVEVPPQLGGEASPGSKDGGKIKAFVRAVCSVTESGSGRERDPIQLEK